MHQTQTKKTKMRTNKLAVDHVKTAPQYRSNYVDNCSAFLH